MTTNLLGTQFQPTEPIQFWFNMEMSVSMEQ